MLRKYIIHNNICKSKGFGWSNVGPALLRHGEVRTASRQVRMYVNKLCMPDRPSPHNVYACQTMSGHPDMAGRIFTHLSQIVYKLPEVVRPYRPSRQVATRCSLFVQNVCTQCLDLSGHTGRRGMSEQFVATGCATGPPRFLFQPCRAIIMLCRTSRMSCAVHPNRANSYCHLGSAFFGERTMKLSPA